MTIGWIEEWVHDGETRESMSAPWASFKPKPVQSLTWRVADVTTRGAIIMLLLYCAVRLSR